MIMMIVFLIDALQFVLLRIIQIRTLGSWPLIGFFIRWFHSLSMCSLSFWNGNFFTVHLISLFGCLIALLLLSSIYLSVYCITKAFKFCGNHRLIVDERKVSDKFTLVHFLPSCFITLITEEISQISYAFQSMKMYRMV